MNLKNITADKLVALYRNRDLSVTEVIKNVYEEIDRVDGNVKAFLSISPDRALDEARRLDAKISADEPLDRLAGVPVAIKDNMAVRVPQPKPVDVADLARLVQQMPGLNRRSGARKHG